MALSTAMSTAMGPELTLATILVAFAGVFLICFMKGAFGGGFSIVGIPLLSIVMDPVTAGGLLAPLFIAMDLFALRYWKPSTWSKPDLVLLLPGLIGGIAFGYVLFRFLDHRAQILDAAARTAGVLGNCHAEQSQLGQAGEHRPPRIGVALLNVADRLGPIAPRGRIACPIAHQLTRRELLGGALTIGVLICWDHAHIPALASALPLVHGTVIPKTWPDDRFDVIWTFTRVSNDEYSFDQVPQLLLSGDTDTIIAAG